MSRSTRYSVAVSAQPETGQIAGRARIANLANILTLLRLVMVPVFLLALFYGGGHHSAARVVAWAIFATACITDRFDGLLARNYGMATEFGAFVDPIADKTLIGSALIGLSMLGDLPWWVTVLILTRELGVTVLRLAVIRRGVIPASWGGKLKTFVQAVAIGLFVLPLSGPLHVAAVVVMAAAILLTVITGVDYVARALRDIGGSARPPADCGNQPHRRRRSPDDDCEVDKEFLMAALVREVVGDVLRGARMSQGRTLREVSDSARVSLGYLSEIERGRKEPSSELLSAICTALQLPLSVVLIDAGERMARQERLARATPAGRATGATIDASTKVVIAPVVSLAVA